MPLGHSWTPKEVQQVEQMRLDGYSCQEIAARVGHSKIGVYQLVHRMKLSPKFSKVRAKWLHLFQLYGTIKRVIEETGAPRGTVKDAGWQLRKAGAI